MALKNSKLIPFLKEGLREKSFFNLKPDDDNTQAFTLKFPRYEKSKPLKVKVYEKILIEWFIKKNKQDEYPGYSIARASLLSALNRSDYLVHEPKHGNKLRYRFANPNEIKEKRQRKKEKLHKLSCNQSYKVSDCQPVATKYNGQLMYNSSSHSLPSPDPPPSISSGYQSASDDFDENMQATEEPTDPADLDLLDDVLMNPESYVQNVFNDIFEDNRETVPLEDIKIDDLFHPSDGIPNLVSPAVELNPVVINTSTFLKTFWLCTQKINVGSMLLLICEKQVIQGENEGIAAGQIVIPNNVWEPGEQYRLQKMFQLEEKYFLFWLPSN